MTAVFGVLLYGCGGAGSSGNGGGGGSGAANNVYAGTYTGQFEDSSSMIGTFSLSVSNTGGVGGQMVYNPVLSFTGTINTQGTGYISINGLTPQITLGTPGQLTLDGGILYGNGSGAYFTLVKNPPGTFGVSNPFSGDYAGTRHNITLGVTGITAMNISASGVVTGCELVDVNGTPTLSTISGTRSSSGTLSYTDVVNSVTFAGTVALSSGTITGNLTGSNGDSATISISQVE